MKDEFEGIVIDNSYSGWNGWVDETILKVDEYTTFEDKIEPFLGKKVKITIQEIQ